MTVAVAAGLLAEASAGERRAVGLDRLAGELEREAADLAGRLDGVLYVFTDAVWRGPAAQRGRDRLRTNQARLRSASDELRRVAALLRRRAGDARAESTSLRRQADRVTVAGTARSGSVPLPA